MQYTCVYMCLYISIYCVYNVYILCVYIYIYIYLQPQCVGVHMYVCLCVCVFRRTADAFKVYENGIIIFIWVQKLLKSTHGFFSKNKYFHDGLYGFQVILKPKQPICSFHLPRALSSVIVLMPKCRHLSDSLRIQSKGVS